MSTVREKYMQKIFCSFLLFVTCCTGALASNCSNDEKFIKIDGNQIGYSMYNESLYANKLIACENKLDCGLYTGGEWALKNNKSDDFNIKGVSLCLDSDEYNKDKNKAGPYCHCRIQELDNYKVLSDWFVVNYFQDNTFDESKQYSSAQQQEYEKQKIAHENTKDCMNNCAEKCKSNLYRLIKTVYGYYDCGTALYKKTNVKCIINNKFINVKNLFVFDDVAEINMGDNSIGFARDKSNVDDLIYIGKFEYNTIYLKVKNNQIYVGRTEYSMEECM